MRPSDLLLVEHDPRIVRALIPAFEVCGHQWPWRPRGASALPPFAASSWDAMIVDLGQSGRHPHQPWWARWHALPPPELSGIRWFQLKTWCC